jgi:Malate/L-lactate dehydrogenase
MSSRLSSGSWLSSLSSSVIRNKNKKTTTRSCYDSILPLTVSSSSNVDCDGGTAAAISTVVKSNSCKINNSNNKGRSGCSCNKSNTNVIVNNANKKAVSTLTSSNHNNIDNCNGYPIVDNKKQSQGCMSTFVSTTGGTRTSVENVSNSERRCPKTGNIICYCSKKSTSISNIVNNFDNIANTSTIELESNEKDLQRHDDIHTLTAINSNTFTEKRCPRTGSFICNCSKQSTFTSTIIRNSLLSTIVNSNIITLPTSFPIMSHQYDNTLVSAQQSSTYCRWMTTTKPTTTTVTAKTDSPTSSLPKGFVFVTISEAYETTKRALQQIGWDENDSSIQAEIMVSAELCGNNQGLVKMYQPKLMSPAINCSKPIIERSTINSAVINGNQSPGMIVAQTASDVVVNKLQSNTNLAISIVSTYNTSTSSGQLAYYVERIAQQGFIGIAMCNSPEFVAPIKGAKSVFGTNPLAISIPLANSPYPFTVRIILLKFVGYVRVSVSIYCSSLK